MNRNTTNFYRASDVHADILRRGYTCAVWYTGTAFQVSKRYAPSFDRRAEQYTHELVGVYRPTAVTIAMLNVDMQQAMREAA